MESSAGFLEEVRPQPGMKEGKSLPSEGLVEQSKRSPSR